MSAPEHNPDDAAFRAALRREKLAARRALDAATHAAHSARLAAHLEPLLRDCAATLPDAAPTLAFCAPIDNEFDARPLVARLLAEGWRAAMPVVVIPAAPMIFRAWTPTTPMTTDRHGIPVPVEIPADPTTGDAAIVADSAPNIVPNIAPDILLLPLVAFDAAGYRLGYGGGYFDRTLAARVPRPRAIGVGFELARVPDTRPQAHDLPLDAIVTEAGVTRFQRSQ